MKMLSKPNFHEKFSSLTQNSVLQSFEALRNEKKKFDEVVELSVQMFYWVNSVFLHLPIGNYFFLWCKNFFSLLFATFF